MYEKLIKQLRNQGHCKDCPYTVDCDSFDSCLMDLLAAEAIENMNKRIVKLEKALQEYYQQTRSWEVDYDNLYKRIITY